MDFRSFDIPAEVAIAVIAPLQSRSELAGASSSPGQASRKKPSPAFDSTRII